MQRTIRIQLKPSDETIKTLTHTIEQYTWSFNAVCQLGWDKGITTGVILHKETYYDHRTLTGLPSQLVCAARVKATEALKSIQALQRKKKTVTCPVSKRCSIRYDARSYTVWFDRQELTILTISGRVKLSFELAEYYRQYLSWNRTSADLIRDRKHRWRLHIVIKRKTPIARSPRGGGFSKTTSNPEVMLTKETVGVDLGITNPATDSRNEFYGGKHWQDIEDRTFQLRRRLQSQGTKRRNVSGGSFPRKACFAKRHLQKLSGRQRRFRKDCDHVLSKRLVQSVGNGATIAFEDLTNIRGRAKMRKAQRRRLHSWSFAQFQAFVSYKAESRGIAIGFVDPRYTSQKCSQCGYIERGNRPTQSEFLCKKCRFECHADLNAALNIREDFLRRRASARVSRTAQPSVNSLSMRLLWSAQRWEVEFPCRIPLWVRLLT